MSTRIFRFSVLSLGIAAATVVASATTPAYAQSGHPHQPAIGSSAAHKTLVAQPQGIAAITNQLARQVALSLANRAERDRIVAATARGPVDLATAESGTALESVARTADRAVLAAKGLTATNLSLLQLRLADPQMSSALRRGEAPLVAATPTDDAVTSLTAYDRTGSRILLDPRRAPRQPVLMLEVNVSKALPAGLQLMRSELAAHHVLAGEPSTASPAISTLSGGYWATKINAVRLSNDQEPWFKGAAEIYSVVGGWDIDGKATAAIVQMPYLDYDGTTYYPNQLLVHFNAYKYNLADVVMMEDDGDTNYQQLTQAIIAALLFIVDAGAYTPLVNAILAAIPTSWWTDDPDYVDSWYTLSTASSGRLYGAAANGWMDVVPYWVSVL